MKDEITAEQALYANQKLFSDVNPYEIVKKISEKTLEIREMDSKNIGESYGQEWEFSSNMQNPIVRIRLRKNGIWKDSKGIKYRLSLTPERYYDYGF